MASVIANDRETTEDLLNSATRFKQIANLWELSAVRPGSALRTLLTTNTDLLCRALSRLLEGPSMRWEKMPDGTHRGYPIDMGYEAKSGFLAEVAAVHESAHLAAMACRLSETLAGEWERQGIDFGPVLRLLATITENSWFLDHRGREMYRRLLNGLLDGLASARAGDWLDLLAFPTKALEWTEDDETRLKTALSHYEEDGARDERHDCSTVDELAGLRESLSKLHVEYGLDLAYEIGRLDEDISERSEGSPDSEEGSGYWRDRTPVRLEVTTDDDVREMFRTLREEK